MILSTPLCNPPLSALGLKLGRATARFRAAALLLSLTTAAVLATAAHASALTCADFARRGVANLSAGDVVTITATVNELALEHYDSGQHVATATVGQPATYVVPSNLNGAKFNMWLSNSETSRGSWSCTHPQQQQPQASNGTSSATSSQQIIAQQSGARVQAIVTNNMGSSRQIDRLMDLGTGGGGGAGTSGGNLAPNSGFTADEKRALDVASNGATSSRLGLGMSDSRNGPPLGAQLGLRATYDDDLTSPMRVRGPGGSDGSRGGGMNVGGLNLYGGDGGAFNFSTSLRDVTRAAQQQDEQRLKDDPSAAALGFTGARSRALDTRANPLDVWVEGRFLRLNDGRDGADLSGYSGLFGTGVDYVFNRNLLAGVSLSYDVSGQKSSAAGTEARGTGWLAGPYATVRLSPQVFWQSRAAWGRASTDVSPNLTVTDSFGSTRWLASTKLTGRYQMGPWQLRPSAGIAYMEETSDSYRSGTGANVDSIRTRVGTASAGPEISYQYRLSPSVLIEPRAGIEAIWSFARDISVGGNSAIVGSEAVGPGGVRGRAELGLRTMIVGGTVVDVSGAYDGIGAGDYNTVTGRAVVRVPLN